jgi:hypothetical protein
MDESKRDVPLELQICLNLEGGLGKDQEPTALDTNLLALEANRQ